ncbi:MAG: heavy-metal-associated domain-containing protein [Proteobacteria bacterium]|nr:heavy-metal-associated domain-containing protein [Pseudomonadota bacterium]
MTKTYIVEGMTCSGCVNAVTKAIKAKDSSAEVQVDLGSGKVNVDGSLDEAAVIEAVEDAGFDYKGLAG